MEMIMETRPAGFYWVLRVGDKRREPLVAQWVDTKIETGWLIPGEPEAFMDAEFKILAGPLEPPAA